MSYSHNDTIPLRAVLGFKFSNGMSGHRKGSCLNKQLSGFSETPPWPRTSNSKNSRSHNNWRKVYYSRYFEARTFLSAIFHTSMSKGLKEHERRLEVNLRVSFISYVSYFRVTFIEEA